MLMPWRFRTRLTLLDERSDVFLKTLAHLGGYCTAEQAARLGIAQSPTRVRAHLKGLEDAGFLRRVASYPVVYQVTKSTMRLLGRDMWARRAHATQTIRSKLLTVNFYLEAKAWPARLVFDHHEKIAAFSERGYPPNLLPQRAGKPYLWDDFILKWEDGRLWVALIDWCHHSPFMQLWRLGKRFRPCFEYLPDKLELLVVVGSAERHRNYRRIAARHSFQKLAQGRFKIPVKLYRVERPVPFFETVRAPETEPPPNDEPPFFIIESL